MYSSMKIACICLTGEKKKFVFWLYIISTDVNNKIFVVL